MNPILCHKLRVAYWIEVASISGTTITLKNGKSFITVEAVNSIRLSTEEKNVNENPFEAYTVELSKKLFDDDFVNYRYNAHFILELTFSDGSIMVLGTVIPENPVLISKNRSETAQNIRFIWNKPV